MASKPIMHGDNVAVDVLIDDAPFEQSDMCLSIDIEPKVVDHEDKHLGNKRDELDQQLRGWTVKMSFDHADNLMLKAWQRVVAAREARTAIPRISIALTFELRDGTTETWVLQGVVMKPKLSIGGAEDNAKLEWDGMAKNYTQSS